MWPNELNIEVEVVSGNLDCLALEDGTGIGCAKQW